MYCYYVSLDFSNTVRQIMSKYLAKDEVLFSKTVDNLRVYSITEDEFLKYSILISDGKKVSYDPMTRVFTVGEW